MKTRIILLGALAATVGCKSPFHHNLPPSVQMTHPGPGVGGPGPGVMLLGNGAGAGPVQEISSQVHFVGPEGMQVTWDAGGMGQFDSEPLVAPGRFNFGQGAIYRLKLTEIPARPGIELYPTLEIAPTMPRTDAYLAHNAIPFQLTEEDFDQVLTGNFVTKVIYLPDAEFQELAIAGVETLVSTRLDPGIDPIVEADRRGSIMAIIRLGNKDLEVPGVQETVDGTVAAAGEGAPGFVSGVSTAQYGMPITGTPLGLPGPPHIPLGTPAGLQKQVIRNHTFTKIPEPVDTQRIHVRQTPGMSYPRPPSTAYIQENARTAFRWPFGRRANDCPPQ